MPARPSSTYFYPRRDWWVHVGALVLIIVFLSSAIAIMWSQQLNATLWERALFSGVLLVFTVNIIDKVYFTVYELADGGMILHTQLREVAIPYREMQEIVPTGFRGLMSTKHRKRFALSAHSLTVRVKDPIWKELTVSPESQDLFLDQLLGKIDGERSRRATVSRKK